MFLPPLVHRLCLFAQVMAIVVYFIANFFTILAASVAVIWYIDSLRPVVDWNDPDGPGYRVLEVTPTQVKVRWIELRMLDDCSGRTEISVIGNRVASHIEAYPFIITPERLTFDRDYSLPANVQPGKYQVRVVDIARCNPLFYRRQTLLVPFEVPER